MLCRGRTKSNREKEGAGCLWNLAIALRYAVSGDKAQGSAACAATITMALATLRRSSRPVARYRLFHEWPDPAIAFAEADAGEE